METGMILSAHPLDIIFDNRNKDYGAYDLRMNYDRRLMKALLSTFLVTSLLCLTYVLVAAMTPDKVVMLMTPDIDLVKVNDKDKLTEIPPAQKMTAPVQQTIKDAPPLIVKNDVKITDPVPEQKDIEEAKIGTITTDGPASDDVISAPVNDKSGVVATPRKQENVDSLFTKVEIDAQYPGGMEAWRLFLYRKLSYPEDAINQHIEGVVYVEFIVDRDGSISAVAPVSGPKELYEAAVSTIRKSGKWEPGIQNGKLVRSYKKQPIVFKLAAE